MGNQLSGIAPSQIFPVEHYLTDLPDYLFETSLGSTRFFKVARARFREGPVVVKVFAIHDPSLPLKAYKNQLQECKQKLLYAPNCLAFQKSLSTDRAELLFRQYVKDNLYDRISTRPFLNNIEKKWIAFQILCALNQCHKFGVCHGDIKLENVMVTGWNWVLLTDFASFKPTYLPEDNPADFSYFFDTSRRRTCYIAPERFVKTFNADILDNPSGSHLVFPNDEYRKGDLTPAMDVFSAGCVLSELFTEGHVPFDFSQLLSYRSGDYTPGKVIRKIEDSYVKELVLHMIQMDPTKRLSAEGYLEKQCGRAFPQYFYTFLYKYIQGFSGPSLVSPEDKISRIRQDVKHIVSVLEAGNATMNDGNTERGIEGLVVIVSLVTSCLRAIRHCTGKLQVLEILQELAPFLSDEVILDRLLPYMLHLLNDPYPQVRLSAIEVLTDCLTLVKTVPKSDANIFPEYLLPQLAQKVQDSAVIVRVTLAKNIAALAETALRFLEMSQLENPNFETNEESHFYHQATYDSELKSLHELIQQYVSNLLTDSDNIVKRTLLEFGITRLCVFFGRQKANDVLLSHIITVLNDKEDRHLRGAFFDSIIGVAAYIGWQCSPILKPLLQQGLNDVEEFVTSKALNAITCLTELGLFQKHILYDFLLEAAPFLCHPNIWIRNDTAGFICTAARSLNIADIHCKLLPSVEPFLKHPIIQLDNEVILLNALLEPIPRCIFETVIRTTLMHPLMDSLQDRQKRRKAQPFTDISDLEKEGPLKPLYRRLISDGLTEAVEDKILHLKEYLLKVHKAKLRLENRRPSRDASGVGKVNLAHFPHVGRHTVDLSHPEKKLEALTGGKNVSHRKPVAELPGTITGMNEEWQHMFGSREARTPSPKQQDPQGGHQDPPLPSSYVSARDASVETVMPQSPSESNVSMAQLPNATETPTLASSSSSPRRNVEKLPSSDESRTVGVCYTECKLNLDELVHTKREQHSMNLVARETIEECSWDSKQPSTNWRPKGTLVAHLHEHRAAVNRVLVIPNTTLFASCSNDGTVKLWDCERMEKRSVSNRSRHTYGRPDGQIVSLEVCQNHQSLACASDNGAIQVIRIESTTAKMATAFTRMLDPQEEGCVVDMSYFDTGSQSVLTYATMYGSIVGWDLRSPGTAWKLENNPKYGLVTCYCVDRRQCWLAIGTSNGVHLCWDLRFRLPISTVRHPTGARVRRMTLHPSHHSWMVSAVQGNNEVSMWDVETEARQMTLWASTAPPLSQTQASNHATLGFYVTGPEGSPIMITAGSDSRIRYWDLSNPLNNYIVVGAADDFVNPTVVSYRSQLIDGTEVVKEMYSKPRQANDDLPRRGPDSPPAGHLDSIGDIAVYQTSQWLLVSASKDGVIKVWK